MLNMIHMDEQKSGSTFTLNTPMAIIIAGAIVGISLYASNNADRINSPTNGEPIAAGAQITSIPEPTPGPTELSVDDDPVIGNPDAPVTLIEFSDYECPYCKRHFQLTYPQIKADYIDTGKVKMVFRDLPLSFHDPLATEEAQAANCAREQGGDDAYYKMHDILYETTTSNGSGMTIDQMYDLAAQVGLNKAKLKTCVEADTYIDEIQKDIRDAATAGATATPTFFVGVSDPSGTIIGTPIIGAQDYNTFIKPAIDAALAQAGS
ncbi:thioredoxin domain-containing protein [candidate division WWE3 bacterium]|uniref:Thioredoxin domain-containing protein n=1 Tax=candidate division WWE3 bacterium TaxID=2053526 RepID=A0A955RPS9_UNCKA|nr:thioredoxin domain-containing protein [candidate division WWE3 bacterium]